VPQQRERHKNVHGKEHLDAADSAKQPEAPEPYVYTLEHVQAYDKAVESHHIEDLGSIETVQVDIVKQSPLVVVQGGQECQHKHNEDQDTAWQDQTTQIGVHVLYEANVKVVQHVHVDERGRIAESVFVDKARDEVKRCDYEHWCEPADEEAREFVSATQLFALGQHNVVIDGRDEHPRELTEYEVVEKGGQAGALRVARVGLLNVGENARTDDYRCQKEDLCQAGGDHELYETHREVGVEDRDEYKVGYNS
jgi:hypothetical protein